MLRRFHQFWLRLLTPAAKFFLKAGIGPDAITLVGTAGVVLGALIFYPLGQLFWGTVVVTAFVFSDMLDGLMARMSGRSSKWGAFLDSTLDRIGDAAVFGGLTIWFLTGGLSHSPGLTSKTVGLVLGCLALYDLVMGSMTSYAKARAESLGMTANVGIAERADRLVSVLVATGLSGLGVPYVLELVLVALAVASTVTVVQRMLTVRRQAFEAETASETPETEQP
jgi:CDP-diacylglycerol--glycerol-3-phosphate 3-phosphatidyltransferase